MSPSGLAAAGNCIFCHRFYPDKTGWTKRGWTKIVDKNNFLLADTMLWPLGWAVNWVGKHAPRYFRKAKGIYQPVNDLHPCCCSMLPAVAMADIVNDIFVQ